MANFLVKTDSPNLNESKDFAKNASAQFCVLFFIEKLPEAEKLIF